MEKRYETWLIRRRGTELDRGCALHEARMLLGGRWFQLDRRRGMAERSLFRSMGPRFRWPVSFLDSLGASAIAWLANPF